MEWTETKIAWALAIQHFNARHLVIVPNCRWTGHEADLLVVTKGLNLIDIEIKISRSDFKADAKKEKWWHKRYHYGNEGPPAPDFPRHHPPRVYKHYFAMPADIWNDSLVDSLPSPSCGVLLLEKSRGHIWVRETRRAKENRKAPKLTPQQAIDIARLASLRMWDALLKIDSMNFD